MAIQDAPAPIRAPAPSDTDALTQRLFTATIDALEIASVHLGGALVVIPRDVVDSVEG